MRRATAPPSPSPRRPPSSRGRAQLMATSWPQPSPGAHEHRRASALDSAERADLQLDDQFSVLCSENADFLDFGEADAVKADADDPQP